ncbi:DUF5683 domain-containing protein [Mucilaginibacter sp.]|uniref:DUF5683 domain-containing protein n=1 Tax=Mucilaginibacter sp. TaxID=1882438 RepID=UPI003D0D43E6
MYKYLLLIFLLTGCAFTAMSQNPDEPPPAPLRTDTLVVAKADTDISPIYKPKKKKEKVYHPDSLHSPHKAIIRSLILPGWGQVYNHRWWKVPIIYGTLGLLGDAILFNAKYYKEFLAISEYRYHGIVPVKGAKYYAEYTALSNPNNFVSDQAIYDAKDGYRRNRDLSILGFAGFWGINVVEAYIDAKFINSYTVDSNLSMKVAPSLITQPMYALNTAGSYIPGIKITFTIR